MCLRPFFPLFSLHLQFLQSLSRFWPTTALAMASASVSCPSKSGGLFPPSKSFAQAKPNVQDRGCELIDSVACKVSQYDLQMQNLSTSWLPVPKRFWSVSNQCSFAASAQLTWVEFPSTLAFPSLASVVNTKFKDAVHKHFPPVLLGRPYRVHFSTCYSSSLRVSQLQALFQRALPSLEHHPVASGELRSIVVVKPVCETCARPSSAACCDQYISSKLHFLQCIHLRVRQTCPGRACPSYPHLEVCQMVSSPKLLRTTLPPKERRSVIASRSLWRQAPAVHAFTVASCLLHAARPHQALRSVRQRDWKLQLKTLLNLAYPLDPSASSEVWPFPTEASASQPWV